MKNKTKLLPKYSFVSPDKMITTVLQLKTIGENAYLLKEEVPINKSQTKRIRRTKE